MSREYPVVSSRPEAHSCLRYTWRTLARQLVRALVVCLMIGALAANLPVNAAPIAQTNAPNAGTLTIVGASGAQLYTTPGGDVVTTLAAGTVLTAVGRSADSLWVVVYNDNDVAGWVEVSEVVLFGLNQLPVMVEGVTPSAQPTGVTTPGAAVTPVQLPTPTATPPPTATPTPSPTPTETPTPTITPTVPPQRTSSVSSRGGEASLVAVVRGGGAVLFDLPDGTEVAQLPTGTALTAWGRNADGSWLVVTATTGAAGWVQVTSVVVFNVDGLPVLDGTQASVVTEQADGETGTPAPLPEAPGGTPAAPAAEGTSTTILGDGAITATVLVTDSRLNIRSGPGVGFAIVAKAEGGDTLVVTGRNRAATWIEVAVDEAEDGFGWVTAEFVELNSPILGIPVSERAGGSAPDAPTGAQPVVQPVSAVAAPAGRAVGGLSGRLVFQDRNGGTIYVYDFATGTVRELTGGFDPAVSPDGSTVALTRTGGDRGLYLIGIDGSNERLIYSGGESMRGATWSPDGKWIAFVRVAGSYNCRDVGFGICLPNNPFLGDFPLDSRAEFGLSRVDFNGENFRDLNALTSAQAPDWHEDGIVYQVATGLEITQDTPEGQTQALVQAPFYQDPAWQPGGNRIVFQSKEGSHWEIFAVNSDGTGVAALTRPQSVLVDEMPSNVAPAWSPDGTSIVYASTRNAENSAGDWRLWVMDSDGGNQRPLPIDVPIEYSFTHEQLVSWAP